MARVVANAALNMSSAKGLGVLDTAAGLQNLISATQDGSQQVWSVGAAGFLEIGAVIENSETLPDGTFSADFTRLELQSGSSVDAPAKWTVTQIPLSIVGDYVFPNPDVINVSAEVPGMGGVEASVQLDSLTILSLSHTLTSGNFDSFAEYILRLADNITGSNAVDTLLGFAGNDVINGRGGADRINGGAGRDTITWGTGDTVNGGAGKDTLKVTLANLDLTQLNDNKIVNVETINLAGATTLKLGRQDVLAFPGDDIRILGGVGDTVNFTGDQGAGVVEGNFTRYSLGGGASLLIDSDIAVI